MKYLEKQFGISLQLKDRTESDDEAKTPKKEPLTLPQLPNLNTRNFLPLVPT